MAWFVHGERGKTDRVCTCTILHNMLVSDRVVEGDPRARYNPANMYLDLERAMVQQPPDLHQFQDPPAADAEEEEPEGDPQEVTAQQLGQIRDDLRKREEHVRLFQALLSSSTQVE
jgi:hypothetical protein